VISIKRTMVRAAACCGLLLVLGAAPARAEFGLKEADVTFTDEGGQAALVAGSHPFAMTTTTAFNTVADEEGRELPDGQAKDLSVELPPGMIGNPLAAPRCSGADFSEISNATLLPDCSNDSVVGLVGFSGLFTKPNLGEGIPDQLHLPLYNLEPGPGEVAKLGFAFAKVPVTFDVRLQEHSPQEAKPYRVVASVRNISQVIQLYSAQVTIWGVPADHAHDPYRGSCLDLNFRGEPASQGNCPVSAEQEDLAFLTMPRACGGPLATDFLTDSWADPGTFVGTESLTHDAGSPPNPAGIGGCSELEPFDPQVSLVPGGGQADSPSGADFDLRVEDEGLLSGAPGARSRSDIEKTVVTFPEGVTVNPALAGGLEACSLAQVAQETAASDFGSGCPASSKIGSVKVETPLLNEPLTGSVFVAKQQDNPFGSLLAIYVVIKSKPLGISVVLPGKVEPDEKTGQLVTTFDNLPQIPFGHFELHLREGARAPLIMPSACGTYETKVELTPWADPGNPIVETSPFQVGSGPGGSPCSGGAPFAPKLHAGTADPLAGAFSPFALRLSRDDGMGRLAGVEVSLPQGLVGKLAGVPYCGDATLAGIAAMSEPGQGAAELANPSCPAASQIGRVAATAGAGPDPIYIDTGRAYLAGPYKGAPLSIAIVTPAVTGPFDLGNVVVRSALYVDPTTASIRVVSDPLPTILHGIPLDLREVQVSIDRPQFTLNPTSCDESSFTGTALSAEGAAAPIRDRFQVGSCGALGFKPKLSLRLAGQTKLTGHPALHAVLTQPGGEANIRRAAVILPRTEFIEQSHIGNPCTRPQFAAGTCPKKSLLGHAKAITPLLDQPLEGPVYFRSNGGEYELPDVVADLNGQIHVVLVGHVDSVHRKGSEVSRLRTTFSTVPDAPVSRFEMNLFGGRRGLLVNSADLCAHPQKATVFLTGQNGTARELKPALRTSCPKKKRGHHHKGSGK
jgi:hypothetical protein